MVKTVLMLVPVFILVGIAFWLMFPGKTSVIISDQKVETSTAPIPNIDELQSKVDMLEDKLDVLESSNSQLLSKISAIQPVSKKSTTTTSPTKTPVLIPINPGGNVDSTSWTNLTSGSITVDPANYPGYKNAFLIINLSVYQGQGTAYAQLVNTANTLAIIPSRVSTTSFSPVSLTSTGFQLPSGSNTYTIQLYTQVPGYQAQAADSFLQITY